MPLTPWLLVLCPALRIPNTACFPETARLSALFTPRLLFVVSPGQRAGYPIFPCISSALCLYLCSSGGRRKGNSVERTDNTLHAASGDNPAGAGLEPFQTAKDKARSLYKTNLNFPLSSARPDVLTALLITSKRRLQPWDDKDHVSLPQNPA